MLGRIIGLEVSKRSTLVLLPTVSIFDLSQKVPSYPESDAPDNIRPSPRVYWWS